MLSADGKGRSKVITGLNDTPLANSPNEAMSHNGCTINGGSRKANISVSNLPMTAEDFNFIREFKISVSNLPMTAEDFSLIREFKILIDSPSTDNKICSKLTMGLKSEDERERSCWPL